jgi:hypothetical protein
MYVKESPPYPRLLHGESYIKYKLALQQIGLLCKSQGVCEYWFSTLLAMQAGLMIQWMNAQEKEHITLPSTTSNDYIWFGNNA